MIKLKKVTIDKYKSIESEQSFDVEDDITVLVGKNESGKTAILEAITKSNPYGDKEFKFDITHDYPRQERQEFKKSDEDVIVLRANFSIPEEIVRLIGREIGSRTLKESSVTQLRTYRGQDVAYQFINMDIESFWEYKFNQYKIEDEQLKTLLTRKTPYAEFMSHFDGYTEKENENALLDEVSRYFDNDWMTEESIASHLVFKHLHPKLPKYLYYDEYHQLPSKIDLHELRHDSSDRKDLLTARALFELAELDIEDLEQDDEEARISAVESANHRITSILRRYWQTNPNLRVNFHVPPERNVHGNLVVMIRVSSNADGMTLPLNSRSRGFQWFFSFFVWFSKIQEDKCNQYILLLDEPGLNLHASAQRDLLRFVEDLAEDYQIIYTTHSGFMIDSGKLHRVRTVYDGGNGTKISDVATESDPDTLIPLQAALGYDIVQHLSISKNNLLVEGISDLTYLTVMSELLKSLNRTGLRKDIAIVPVGGADKVATFVALLRGQELNIACLLDTFVEHPKKQKVEDMIDYRVIHRRSVRYFHEFVGSGVIEADIEDLFAPSEFLHFYNKALHHTLQVSDLDKSESRIVVQIRKKHKRFNAHYQVAKTLATLGVDASFFSDGTLDRFENMFKEINKLFK